MLSKFIKILFLPIASLMLVLIVDRTNAINIHQSNFTTQANLIILAERNLQMSENPISEELRKNQELWVKQKLKNYRYILQVSCFCPPNITQPVIIDVRSGKTSSITPQTSRNIVNRELFQKYDSIDKLFEIIRSALAKNAHRVDVKYHPTLGYPTQISIDYDKLMADEELFLTINKLETQSNGRFSHP
ncbi:hypothetical protein IQ264_21025 [Phormidium sp. LEGE 05292]|uniref:DUF6174 domain-containing protein n=1 Tax=[Phormidium] sp. LEGE 05292 TaxID=767427 RepID=UPI0018802F3C|nr:DUF6174 domain-containing protein [Phormidium sp. LEGE 05292]MBE9227909.1 hypothetical protein [Phormidium sp. LEGE 05292]